MFMLLKHADTRQIGNTTSWQIFHEVITRRAKPEGYKTVAEEIKHHNITRAIACSNFLKLTGKKVIADHFFRTPAEFCVL